jgi:hypothetical protein
MKKVELGNKLSRAFGKAGLSIKKHSPAILVGAGIIGGVASTILACKATTKLSEITEPAKKDIAAIKEAAAHPETLPEPYTEQDKRKDLTIVYTQTGLKLAKLYAPAFAVGAFSIVSILAGTNILHKRYVGSVAAYTAVSNSFKEYRKRVADRFGDELDKELKYGVTTQEVEEKVTDENGEEKVVKKTINVVNDDPSAFAFFFDDGCKGWEKDAEHNKWYVLRQQAWCNDVLKAKGYLLLNDVYELFGVPKTKAGAQVGWTYDEKNPKGDNYVDFGVFNVNRPSNRDFVNGYERSILLDPNVEGNILYVFDNKKLY